LLLLLFLLCCGYSKDTGKMPVELMGGTPMPQTVAIGGLRVYSFMFRHNELFGE
jgi:hypothetical protein